MFTVHGYLQINEILLRLKFDTLILQFREKIQENSQINDNTRSTDSDRRKCNLLQMQRKKVIKIKVVDLVVGRFLVFRLCEPQIPNSDYIHNIKGNVVLFTDR